MISGPPASGKTYYADMLAKYYNIPKVNVGNLLEEVWRYAKMEEYDGDDEFIISVREKVEELRDEELSRIEEEFNKNKKDTEDDFDPETVNRETLKIRIPDNIMYTLLKKHLNHNDCRNRGYILDGYPRTFFDAQHCFLKTPDLGEDEEFELEDDEVSIDEKDPETGENKKIKSFKGYVVDNNIIPSSCIVLNGDDKFLLDRIRDMPESKIAGTHYNGPDMTRRLKLYREANNSDVAEPSVQEFFAR